MASVPTQEGDRFEEIIQEQKELLEKTIVANIKTSATKGDTRALNGWKPWVGLCGWAPKR